MDLTYKIGMIQNFTKSIFSNQIVNIIAYYDPWLWFLDQLYLKLLVLGPKKLSKNLNWCHIWC